MDVDTGVDDALALLLALSSPEVELVGVSTVAGNVPLPRTTDNTLRLLQWAGGATFPCTSVQSGPWCETQSRQRMFTA